MSIPLTSGSSVVHGYQRTHNFGPEADLVIRVLGTTEYPGSVYSSQTLYYVNSSDTSPHPSPLWVHLTNSRIFRVHHLTFLSSPVPSLTREEEGVTSLMDSKSICVGNLTSKTKSRWVSRPTPIHNSTLITLHTLSPRVDGNREARGKRKDVRPYSDTPRSSAKHGAPSSLDPRTTDTSTAWLDLEV